LLDLAGQDPLAQQIELRATEHLSLDHLDPVDVAFDLPGAIVQAARTNRSRLSRLAGMPNTTAKRAPARPASANPIASNIRRNKPVRRACLLVKPGTCSTNVRRAQLALPQKNRRTHSWITTVRAPIGASANLRR
jgi:hypothetical protein